MSWAPEPFTSYEEYKNSLGEPSARQLREAVEASGFPKGSFGHHESLDAGPKSDAAREALRVILATSKRSRFRRLAIVCRKNHTIGEVYQTSAGLVLTGVGPADGVDAHAVGGILESHYHPEYGHIGDTEWDATWEQQNRASREVPVVCLVDQLQGPVDDVKLQCRCTTAKLDHTDIVDYLATKKKRVVYVSKAQRS